MVIFNLQKTIFIHFIHNILKAKSEKVLESLFILGIIVVSLPLVKILIIIFNQKLDDKAYIA